MAGTHREWKGEIKSVKVRRYDGRELRRVLIGMASDAIVASRVASEWTPDGLFDQPWANLVGSWCVRHVRQYDEAIGSNIEQVYLEWAEKHDDEKTVKAVEKFLRALDDEHDPDDQPSSDFVLDLAGRYFNKVKTRRAIREAEEKLDHGRIDEATSDLRNLGRVELGSGSIVKVNDFATWKEVLDEDKQREVIRFPKPLRYFYEGMMRRKTLIGLMGSDKSAKSFTLLDYAYRALRCRRRVAYFEAGDLSEEDLLERFACRALRRPMQGKTIAVPISFDEETDEVEWEEQKFKRVTPQAVYQAIRRLTRGKDRLRICCYPNQTLSVEHMRDQIVSWNREGWQPDLVCLDYADILAPPSGIKDKLDQIETTWRQLRRLSQEQDALVISPTQASAEVYRLAERDNGVLRRRHFSGRKTKLADVNGLLGIYHVEHPQTSIWLSNINWIVRRKGHFPESRFIRVAGCLDLACPAMVANL